MLEVIFLGVGEAFDEELPNTSILIRCVEGASPVTLLLDCGFTTPPQFWREVPDADTLDGIWVSHFHGDHFLGLPALLVRIWEEGRCKALTVIGQRGIKSITRRALDLAYPHFYEKMEFPMRFLELEPGKDREILGLSMRAAETSHPQRDLALRIEARGKSIYYSGDGKPTAECVELARGSQLIIQEAFHMETEIQGHGTAMGSIDMARSCGASNLALVHIQRKARNQVIQKLQGYSEGSLKVMVPEPGHRIVI
jgi:ribonuclease Z